MADPLLVTLGAVAVTEGVKFLYAQAGEVLKAIRERRKKVPLAVTSADYDPHRDFPGLPDQLLFPSPPTGDQEKAIARAYYRLEPYVEGEQPPDKEEIAKLEAALCAALGNVLKIELAPNRQVEGVAKGRELKGKAAGIDIKGDVPPGNYRGLADFDSVKKGATAAGVRIKSGS